MYDFLHKRKRTVQVILGLITLPFAFFGVDYYFRNTDRTGEVATVAGSRITQVEFDNSLREQQQRMRQTLGANFDPAVFENPEVRYALLEELIGQRLLQEQARRDRLTVADEQVRRFISEIPAFQEDGKFSQTRYEQLLAMQNPPRSPVEFAQNIRQGLMLAPLEEPISGGNIVAKTNVERYLGLLSQQREAAVAAIDPEGYLKDVKIDDAAVKAFYDGTPDAFQVPEEVRIEYVTFSREAMLASQQVSDAEIKAFYDANIAAKYQQRVNARNKIASLLAELKKNPAKFAQLAKENSQDPGSAGQGGDLGFSAPGAFVKPFEDVAFRLKPEQISDIVETDFGFHIIKVTGIKAADKAKGTPEERRVSHILIAAPKEGKDLTSARPEIEAAVKQQKAAASFVEEAEKFQNLVYEQADSLQPVAKALDLKVQSTPPLSRAQIQALAQNNAKFVQAVFSPDSLQAKRNTEAIEVAPGTLMAARVVEYKPAHPRPFDDVKAEIRRQLERKAAGELAQQAGKSKLALLQQGKDAGVNFGKPAMVIRNQPQPGFPPAALTAIFQVDASKLPAYAASANERGGYSLYRIQRLIDPPAPDAARLTAFANRVGDQIGRELAAANIASLRAKVDVKINQTNLEKDVERRAPAERPVNRPGRKGS